MTDVTSTLATPDFMTVLTQVADAYREQSGDRPTAVVVVNALLQAEKATKQQRLTYPFESLLGQWRLCFTTGTKKVRKRGGIALGKGFYIPKFTKAHISFSATVESLDEAPGRGEISNQIQIGPVLLKFEGPAQYVGKKNLVAFDFTQLQVSLSSYTIYKGQIRSGKAQTLDFYNQSITKLPFFSFIAVTESFIAARGRGGGLALWIRER